MTQLSLFDPIQIPLTKGQVAIVDPIDSDLTEFAWRAELSHRYGHHYGYYAVRTGKRPARSHICLHRVIMERILGRSLEHSEQVDHIDCDKLNNTRSNLRVATQTQNHWNTRRPSNNRSGFKGVRLHERTGKWIAAFTGIHIGYFDTPEDAYAAYCDVARKHAGEFARFE